MSAVSSIESFLGLGLRVWVPYLLSILHLWSHPLKLMGCGLGLGKGCSCLEWTVIDNDSVGAPCRVLHIYRLAHSSLSGTPDGPRWGN